jgi:serine/threonine protein kinase
LDAFPGLAKGEPVPYDTAIDMVAQIYKGLRFLPRIGYRCHGDLKPQNCLVHEEGGRLHYRLTDFHQCPKDDKLHINIGYPWTRDPYLLCNTRQPSLKTNLFGLGQIFLFVLSGEYLIPSKPLINQVQEITGKNWDEISIHDRIRYVDLHIKSETIELLNGNLYRTLEARLSQNLSGQKLRNAVRLAYSLMNPIEKEREFIPV